MFVSSTGEKLRVILVHKASDRYSLRLLALNQSPVPPPDLVSPSPSESPPKCLGETPDPRGKDRIPPPRGPQGRSFAPRRIEWAKTPVACAAPRTSCLPEMVRSNLLLSPHASGDSRLEWTVAEVVSSTAGLAGR